MLNYSTIVELVRDRALKMPQQTAYTFLTDGETASARVTYEEVDRQARAIAAQLQSLKLSNNQALVVYPYHQGLEFISAFFGCLYAGVVAVTDNPPRNSQGLLKLQERIISSQAQVALTSKALLEHINYQLQENPEIGPKLKDIIWIATDEVPLSIAADWKQPHINSDTLAFLQYTSGSTGRPKGVMVTHNNVLHNSRQIYTAFQHTQSTIVLMWLPLFHDMGLIGGVIQPIYGGFPVVLMSPVALIQKPLRWLEAISRYQITTSGGANFAYDLLCSQVTEEQRTNLDLSRWDVAFSGAEPVRAETIERFSSLYSACGFRREAFYPCYGMAETTLFMSGGQKNEVPRLIYIDKNELELNKVVSLGCEDKEAKKLVSCGQTWLGDRMIIVNPESLTQCQENQVGEIWFSGAAVGKGYWQENSETENTFLAYLSDTQEGPFLRTGDLGFLQNGEIFITGRLKDMMILWGRNHYPQHIESTVEHSHPALQTNAGAAFSLDVDGEERLVIVQEIKRSYLRRLVVDEVVGAIRKAIAEQHIAEVYAVVLVKTATIPKTSSGKIQRRLCREQWLKGNLEIVGQWQADVKVQSNILEIMN